MFVFYFIIEAGYLVWTCYCSEGWKYHKFTQFRDEVASEDADEKELLKNGFFLKACIESIIWCLKWWTSRKGVG